MCAFSLLNERMSCIKCGNQLYKSTPRYANKFDSCYECYLETATSVARKKCGTCELNRIKSSDKWKTQCTRCFNAQKGKCLDCGEFTSSDETKYCDSCLELHESLKRQCIVCGMMKVGHLFKTEKCTDCLNAEPKRTCNSCLEDLIPMSEPSYVKHCKACYVELKKSGC